METILRLIKYTIILTLFVVYLFTFKNFIVGMDLQNFLSCISIGFLMLYIIQI